MNIEMKEEPCYALVSVYTLLPPRILRRTIRSESSQHPVLLISKSHTPSVFPLHPLILHQSRLTVKSSNGSTFIRSPSVRSRSARHRWKNAISWTNG